MLTNESPHLKDGEIVNLRSAEPERFQMQRALEEEAWLAMGESVQL